MPKKPRRKPNFLVMIPIVLLLGFALRNFHSSLVVKSLTWETVRQDWVKHEKTVQAIFANTEVVITAPVEGEVTYIREDGYRFRKGEIVASLKPSGVSHGTDLSEQAVLAPISGLFYSNRDNLEEIMTPENLMNMELERLLLQAEKALEAGQPAAQTEQQAGQQAEQQAGQQAGQQTEQSQLINSGKVVNKHAPLGKMLNNLYPSWMFVHLDFSVSVAKEDIVKFVIEGEEYVGTVMKVSAKPQGAVIRFTQYVKGTTEKRQREIIWVYKPPTKGLVVPVKSLYTLGEERGVFINNNGVIRFRSVKVLDSNESLACVQGVPEGVSVVVDPPADLEGLPVN
ncbi:MAG TPA: hypothetical protein GXX46_02120 [Peptococcaceae bacterium]|nr:hypothetical protein [Peptococcaceae bacterium]